MLALAAQLQPFLPAVTIRENEALRLHTRFALGGPARYLVDVADSSVLPAVMDVLSSTDLPLITLGGGSNLIVADEGFPGIVLRFTGQSLERDKELTIAESGVLWQRLVDFHTDLSLTGMERMTGIPGWLGGALYGNAGAYGQTVMDFVESVRIFDGQTFRDIPNAECGFAYRTSGFKSRKDWILLSARIRLSPGDPAEVRAVADEILATRNEKFPPSLRCAGSIFKNLHAADLSPAILKRVPAAVIRAGKIPSAWFLDQVGSKSTRLGGIEVAAYHANLIYNTGMGTAAEVCQLIDTLKERVEAEFGLTLEEEVQYIGFPDRLSR